MSGLSIHRARARSTRHAYVCQHHGGIFPTFWHLQKKQPLSPSTGATIWQLSSPPSLGWTPCVCTRLGFFVRGVFLICAGFGVSMHPKRCDASPASPSCTTWKMGGRGNDWDKPVDILAPILNTWAVWFVILGSHTKILVLSRNLASIWFHFKILVCPKPKIFFSVC